MSECVVRLVKEWTETGNVLVGNHSPDSEEAIVGRTLLRCANQLEFALKSKQPLVSMGTAVLAGALLIAEGLPDRQQEHSMIAYSLVPPSQAPIEAPAGPTEHTERETGGESVATTVSVIAASGSNVTAGVSQISVRVADSLRS